jgi:hypothetical protein
MYRTGRKSCWPPLTALIDNLRLQFRSGALFVLVERYLTESYFNGHYITSVRIVLIKTFEVCNVRSRNPHHCCQLYISPVTSKMARIYRAETCSRKYEGESVIIRTVCFIFRKTRAVDQRDESEGVRSRLYRRRSSTSKFSFLWFSTVWAVSASVMDVEWGPVTSPCFTLVRPFLNLSLR